MRTLFLFSLFLISISTLTAKEKNVVFILVDDLGIKDMSIEGSAFYETPHIDQLAKSGVRFTNGYSACQVCSPSRASIMLGTAPPRHGITDWIGASTGKAWKRNDKILPPKNVAALPKDEVTIAEAFKKHGYKTFFSGKWHLGGKGSYPEDHGFDINIGGHSRGSPPGGFFSPYKNPKMKDGPKGESLTLRLAEETAKFIEANKEKKFFAFLSFYAVHSPIQTTKVLREKYIKKGKERRVVDKRFIFDRRMAVRQVQDNPVYAGMMETLDDAVGIVMNKLRSLGLEKDTIVVFTGDNGGVSSGDNFATSCLPYRGGKGRQWQGGIRAPFYVVAPGITKAGAKHDTPAIGMDFYPTLLECAGLSLMPKQHVDGISLVPALKGETMKKRDLFWHYPHYGNQGGEPVAIIISGTKKLIHYYEDDRNELYDIREDVGEKNDIAASHPELTKALRKKLNAWLVETKALIPLKDDRYDAEKKKRQLKASEEKHMKRLEEWQASYYKK